MQGICVFSKSPLPVLLLIISNKLTSGSCALPRSEHFAKYSSPARKQEELTLLLK